MNTIQKIKKKIVDHRHEIFAVGFVGSIIALTVVLENNELKNRQAEEERLHDYIIDQNRKGKTVYQLANGSYIGVTVE